MRDEGSEWRNWFISDLGPVLPPCPDSTCSALEKLVIVQLCGCVVCESTLPDVCAQVATR
jgi:hypothetical protein